MAEPVGGKGVTHSVVYTEFIEASQPYPARKTQEEGSSIFEGTHSSTVVTVAVKV